MPNRFIEEKTSFDDTNHSAPAEIRKIRSFIRRQGRITAGQQQALDEHWDKYCLAPDADCRFGDIFGREAPVIVEIGFGNGISLAEMAAANPQNDYIGIEVHKPGVGHLIMQLEKRQLSNVRIYYHDAIEILERCIPGNSLDGVHLFFPDPWPKKRHHKRRIVKPEFIELVTAKLKPGGYFHCATDWRNYAEQMLRVLANAKGLHNTDAEGGYSERPAYRPLTKFENRGLRLGHGVWDLIFLKD